MTWCVRYSCSRLIFSRIHAFWTWAAMAAPRFKHLYHKTAKSFAVSGLSATATGTICLFASVHSWSIKLVAFESPWMEIPIQDRSLQMNSHCMQFCCFLREWKVCCLKATIVYFNFFHDSSQNQKSSVLPQITADIRATHLSLLICLTTASMKNS